MRYLACFNPTKILTDKLLKDGLSTYEPSSGWHCTLWPGFNIQEEDEKAIQRSLSSIKARPFTTETIDFSIFYEDSYVLTLSKSSELQDLHEKVVKTARQFDKDRTLFDESVRRFGLK